LPDQRASQPLRHAIHKIATAPAIANGSMIIDRTPTTPPSIMISLL
jgi:hypothetical protein